MADLRVILGLWDGHDAGVALVVDGELRFALSEERLARKKRASGFPYRALQACWSHCNIDPSQVDAVAVPGRYGRLLHRAADRLYRQSNRDRSPLSVSSTLIRNLEIGVARLPGVRSVEAMASQSVLV